MMECILNYEYNLRYLLNIIKDTSSRVEKGIHTSHKNLNIKIYKLSTKVYHVSITIRWKVCKSVNQKQLQKKRTDDEEEGINSILEKRAS